MDVFARAACYLSYIASVGVHDKDLRHTSANRNKRDGSAVRQLTDALGGSKDGGFTNPRWSPDGTRILCSRRLNGITLAVFKAPD